MKGNSKHMTVQEANKKKNEAIDNAKQDKKKKNSPHGS
jgi:hypothetical protein